MNRNERTKRSSRNKNPVYTYPTTRASRDYRELPHFKPQLSSFRGSRKRSVSRWQNESTHKVGVSKLQKLSNLEVVSRSKHHFRNSPKTKNSQAHLGQQSTTKNKTHTNQSKSHRGNVKREVRAATSNRANFNSNQKKKICPSSSPLVITVHVADATLNTFPPKCSKKGDSFPATSLVTEIYKPAIDIDAAASSKLKLEDHANPTETFQKECTKVQASLSLDEDDACKDKKTTEDYYPNSTVGNVDSITLNQPYSVETCKKLQKLYLSSRETQQQRQMMKTGSRVIVMPEIIEYYNKLEAQNGKSGAALLRKLKERLYGIAD